MLTDFGFFKEKALSKKAKMEGAHRERENRMQ